MEKLIEWARGKKTYIIAIVVVVLGLLQGLDIFVLPDAVWPIIAACGLATLRSGVNKVAGAVKPKKKK